MARKVIKIDAKCKSCGVYRTLKKRGHPPADLCRSCAIKNSQSKHGHPSVGKIRLPKARHANVSYTDTKLIYIENTGKTSRLYRQTCTTCKKDSGYRKNTDYNRMCHDCHVDMLYKKDNPYLDYNDRIYKAASSGNLHAFFMATCPQCGNKSGYHKTTHRNLKCKPCIESNKISKDQKRLRLALSANIRNRLHSRKSGKKSKSLFLYLTYTMEELIEHLEKQFYTRCNGDEMTWENYGANGWHLDHVIPDSKFRYTSPTCQSFKDSWSLSNLQPMWGEENTSKQSRYSGPFDISKASSSYHNSVDRLVKIQQKE